jgi:hypothetical protein
MSDFKPILPGTAEFADAMKMVGEFDGGVLPKGMAIPFEEESIPNSSLVIRHAQISTEPEYSKVVLHIMKGTTAQFTVISQRLRDLVQEMNISGTFCEAGMSPLWPSNQFDLVLFAIPDMVAASVRKRLVQVVRETIIL